MVNYQAAALDTTFAALADPTRRAILARLARGQASVSELAEPFRVSLPAVVKHVSVLEKARLVRTEKSGRVRRCRLSPAPLHTAAEWIEFYQRFWEVQFDRLERFIEEMKQEDPSWRPRTPQGKLSKSSAHSPRRARKSSKHGQIRP